MVRPMGIQSEGRVGYRKKGKYYQARWTEGERQREVSLRVTNKDRAKILCRQINDSLEKGEPWEWVLGRLQKGERTFRDLVDEYLERGSRWSETTRRQNSGTVNRLVAEFGDWPVTQIERRDIEGYLARRRDEGLSKASRNRYLCALKVMFAAAEEWGYLRESPVDRLKTEPEGRKMPRPYYDEEVDRLLWSCRRITAPSSRCICTPPYAAESWSSCYGPTWTLLGAPSRLGPPRIAVTAVCP